MRYGLGGISYLDDNGEPLSGGKMYFYETGTTTLKDTYSDEAESVANTNPVILDAAGRQPDIFFTGQAKVVLRDSVGAMIDTTDPVGEAANETPLGAWSASVTYAVRDLARGSNGLYYKSIVSSNVGHDPISSPTYWAEVRFVDVYNAAFSYLTGDLAFYSNALWVSLSSSNVGNTPSNNSAYWRTLNTQLATDFTPKTGNFNAAVGTHYLIDTSGSGFTMMLPASPSVGDSIGFTDYSGTFAADNFDVGRNGNNILGSATDLTCNISSFSGTLVFSGATKGWIFAQ